MAWWMQEVESSVSFVLLQQVVLLTLHNGAVNGIAIH